MNCEPVPEMEERSRKNFGKNGGWGLKVPIEQYTVVNIAMALRAAGGAV